MSPSNRNHRMRKACPGCEGLEARAMLTASPGLSGIHEPAHPHVAHHAVIAHHPGTHAATPAHARSVSAYCQSTIKARLSQAARTAVEAYTYGYPLLLMEATERALIAETGVPVNAFYNQSTPVTSADTTVIRPNVNTLYSMAWLDLSKGPQVLGLPDMQNQYVVMEILDAWTNVIATPGTATTGTAAQQYAIVGPDWQGTLPAGMTAIHSTTDLVWILGRTALNPDIPNDLDTVHALQAQYTLSPLDPTLGTTMAGADTSALAAGLAAAAEGNGGGGASSPTSLIQGLPAKAYFQLLSGAMIQNPAFKRDAPALRKFATIGFVPGKAFRPTPAAARILPLVPKMALKAIEAKENRLGTVENNWQMILQGIGTYGVKYLDRAAVANQGLGANLPQTAVYPTTSVDSNNQPLNGSNTYNIHFAAGQTPPVASGAFWSVTLYDSNGNLENNPQGISDVSSYTSVPNADGSLDLYVGPTQPAGANAANWLPSLSGNYELTLRLYDPEESVLTGAWKPPAVTLVAS